MKLEIRFDRVKISFTKTMNDKPRHGQETIPRSTASHGAFKHTAKPATFKTVLNAFGLEKSAYERSKAYVLSRAKEPAHAR